MGCLEQRRQTRVLWADVQSCLPPFWRQQGSIRKAEFEKSRTLALLSTQAPAALTPGEQTFPAGKTLGSFLGSSAGFPRRRGAETPLFLLSAGHAGGTWVTTGRLSRRAR